MSSWLLLIVAGLLEIVWATALKQADGFTRLWPSLIGVGTAALSLVLLSVAARDLPMGTAYAVWVGIGMAGVAAAGILMGGESASAPRLLFLGLILVGVAGLKAMDA